jgi:hypothetical protein
MKKDRSTLIKEYHLLCRQKGFDEEARHQFLWDNYRKYSSRFLSDRQLEEVCNLLSGRTLPQPPEARKPLSQPVTPDRWRKRLMAAIAAWAKIAGAIPDDSDPATVIKAIALQAAGGQYGHFNLIPVDRLRNLYYAFVKKAKDYKNVDSLDGMKNKSAGTQ